MPRTLIIVGTLLVAVLLVLGACAPTPAPTPTPTTAQLASTPAEIVEVVKVGIDRSTVQSLIDSSKFELVAVQLSEFSDTGGKIKMVPRQAGAELPATHVVHLYFSGEYHPAYVAYSMSKGWEVVGVGRISPENAQWLVEHKAT